MACRSINHQVIALLLIAVVPLSWSQADQASQDAAFAALERELDVVEGVPPAPAIKPAIDNGEPLTSSKDPLKDTVTTPPTSIPPMKKQAVAPMAKPKRAPASVGGAVPLKGKSGKAITRVAKPTGKSVAGKSTSKKAVAKQGKAQRATK